MMVQIVLVILIAVQVNSQELRPSVCQCNGDSATCTDLFSDVTYEYMTQGIFHSALRRLGVTRRTRLELEEDLFLRWNITSLTFLELSQNYVWKIWQRAFYSLADLEELDLSGNSITTLQSQTFYNNTRLFWLSVSKNGNTDLHSSTFQYNFKLRFIFMSGNKITSLHPDLFKNSVQVEMVRVADKRFLWYPSHNISK
jgi:hypothetical protein